MSRAAQSREARRIAQDHLDVSEQPVSDEHRLGALHVRVAGHHGIAGSLRACSTSALAQAASASMTERDLLAHVEAQIGGDLLVAAAAGVQLEAERADALDECKFDEVMNVFGGRVIAHQRLAGFGGVVGGNRVERVADGCAFIRR